MKKIVLAFVFVATFFVLPAYSLAHAGDGGLYISAKGGIGILGGDKTLAHNQTKLKNNNTDWKSNHLSYGASVGWDWMGFDIPIRTELEYYKHGSVKMGHSDANATFTTDATDIQTLQFNLFYDFHNKTIFIPYVGAGVGKARLTSGSESKDNMSYSLFAGSAVKLTEMVLLDFTYRVNNFGDGFAFSHTAPKGSYSGKMKNMYAVEGTVGIRIQF